MEAERRDQPRNPAFTQANLLYSDPVAGERELPILLRDVSDSGIGAVYIGQEPPPGDGDLRLTSDRVGLRPVRVAWTRQVADYVYLLGLEIV
jgi:hypothetical protein